MLLQLVALFSLSHAYIASDQLQIRPGSLVEQMRKKKLNFETSQTDKSLKADLKAGRVQLDPYMPEPPLVALKKEIDANEKNLEQAKAIAKFVIYQAVEKRWSYDLEYTVLNDISASNFAQYSPNLLDVLGTQTTFMGTVKQAGKTYLRFQIADWGFVSVNNQLTDAKWNIEFDSTADNNRVSDSIKKLKSRE